MESPQRPSTEIEHWEVVSFDGSDTLCLARFVQHVLKTANLHKQCVVFVEGTFRKSGKEAKVVARPLKGEIDCYVRNLTIKEIPSTKEWTVGCRGATLEDICADTVSFFFFGVGEELKLKLANSPFAFFLRKRKAELTVGELDFLIRNMQLHAAVATAKRRRDQIALEKLSDILKKNLEIKRSFGLNLNEMVADGFRVFEDHCASNANAATRATKILRHYVISNLRGSVLPNAVIYAIESLGRVTKHWNDTKHMLGKLLEKVLKVISQREKAGCTEEDIVWASLVALKRTGGLGFNKKILDKPEIKVIITRHRFSDILQDLLKQVIKSKHIKESSLSGRQELDATRSKGPREQTLDRESPHSYFLSYSRKDVSATDHVELILRRKKREVLRDENGIRASEKLDDRIKAMIANSDTFIALWSKAYNDSGWCSGELTYALDRRKRSQKPSRIVLITLDKTDLPLRVRGCLCPEGYERDRRELTVQKVVADEGKLKTQAY